MTMLLLYVCQVVRVQVNGRQSCQTDTLMTSSFTDVHMISCPSQIHIFSINSHMLILILACHVLSDELVSWDLWMIAFNHSLREHVSVRGKYV